MIAYIISTVNNVLYSYALIIILVIGGLYFTFRALKDYRKQKKAGLTPTFNAKDIGIPHELDYWN